MLNKARLKVYENGHKKILSLVELGFKCQNFPFPQLFSRAHVKPLKKVEEMEMF